MLAGMECAGSLVTVRDGDFSSPDAPRGTGGPKSKPKSRDKADPLILVHESGFAKWYSEPYISFGGYSCSWQFQSLRLDEIWVRFCYDLRFRRTDSNKDTVQYSLVNGKD